MGRSSGRLSFVLVIPYLCTIAPTACAFFMRPYEQMYQILFIHPSIHPTPPRRQQTRRDVPCSFTKPSRSPAPYPTNPFPKHPKYPHPTTSLCTSDAKRGEDPFLVPCIGIEIFDVDLKVSYHRAHSRDVTASSPPHRLLELHINGDIADRRSLSSYYLHPTILTTALHTKPSTTQNLSHNQIIHNVSPLCTLHQHLNPNHTSTPTHHHLTNPPQQTQPLHNGLQARHHR